MDLKQDPPNLQVFLKEIIDRGLGIYGKEKMAELCFNSQIGLLDDYSIDWLSDNHMDAVSKLIENYSQINLPAKMTVMVLAKKHGIELPSSLQTNQKKKSKFFKIIGK